VGDNGRFRALAALYVGLVVLCAVFGIWASYSSLTTLALVLTLPTGFGYGPLGFLPGLARLALPDAGDLGPHVVSVVLIGGLAVANVFVLRWLRRVLPADPAAAGVADRLDRTLVGSGVAVTPMARKTERVRTETGQVRLERSLDLRDLPMPYRDLLGMFRAMWQGAGLSVQERPDPPAVRAYDEQGYEFLVEPGPFGEAVLQVASPPARERGFVAGALVSGVPTAMLFLLGVARYIGAGGDGRHPMFPLIAGCLVVGPGALVVGLLCQFRHRAQMFGRGLLLGGLPSLAVALLYLVPVALQGG
jgi:hypothetical protein